ncbi:uncharacterized protein LOC108302861 [Cebus imitator]|uniref:uncharacterized protein LOC108302861 n=1 Tax=Cebus imitator TaxID=2715852 RepID=UPI000809F788|nr:uncharacterized protein LOC108302861 [Cebus imitator]
MPSSTGATLSTATPLATAATRGRGSRDSPRDWCYRRATEEVVRPPLGAVRVPGSGVRGRLREATGVSPRSRPRSRALPLWFPQPSPRPVFCVWASWRLCWILDRAPPLTATQPDLLHSLWGLGPRLARCGTSRVIKTNERVLGGSGCLCPEGGVGEVVGKWGGKKRKAFSPAASGPTSTRLFQPPGLGGRALGAGTFQDQGGHRAGPASLDPAPAFPGRPGARGQRQRFLGAYFLVCLGWESRQC